MDGDENDCAECWAYYKPRIRNQLGCWFGFPENVRVGDFEKRNDTRGSSGIRHHSRSRSSQLRLSPLWWNKMSRTETKRREGRQWKQVIKCCSYSDTSQNVFDSIWFASIRRCADTFETRTYARTPLHWSRYQNGKGCSRNRPRSNFLSIQTNNVWMHACMRIAENRKRRATGTQCVLSLWMTQHNTRHTVAACHRTAPHGTLCPTQECSSVFVWSRWFTTWFGGLNKCRRRALSPFGSLPLHRHMVDCWFNLSQAKPYSTYPYALCSVPSSVPKNRIGNGCWQKDFPGALVFYGSVCVGLIVLY